jgi:DNA polymerase-3 subunit delta
MITLLTGTNSYEIERELQRVSREFSGEVEKVDGSTLDLRSLPDLLMGGTLFADKRLIIIKNLSENVVVWPVFADWLDRVSSDVTLVLVDAKPDKRTLTYKALQKNAVIKDLAEWTDRDGSIAEKWAIAHAKELGYDLDTKSAQALVRRIGVDQWQLHHGLEKLALVPTVTPSVIEEIIDLAPSENVFNLFDAALRGDTRKVTAMLRTLELTEDPYRLFALLSGQAFQLAAVAVAAPDDAVAKDLGVHPYAVSKLEGSAKKLGRAGARKVIAAFAKADDDVKLSRGDPWLLIERTLLKVAQ